MLVQHNADIGYCDACHAFRFHALQLFTDCLPHLSYNVCQLFPGFVFSHVLILPITNGPLMQTYLGMAVSKHMPR
jgi:hypothetical protein